MVSLVWSFLPLCKPKFRLVLKAAYIENKAIGLQSLIESFLTPLWKAYL